MGRLALAAWTLFLLAVPRSSWSASVAGPVTGPDCVVTDLAPDHPDEARRWRRMGWLDEHGRIEPGVLARALSQRQATVSSARAKALTRASWISRGPQNCGGRSRAIVVDPRNTSVLYAASVGGGVWKSVDRGASWTPLMDFAPTLAASCLVLDPTNSNVVYAGTGEGFFNGDALGGAGIFKSTDAGATWAPLPGTSGFGSINRIAIQPGNAGCLICGTTYGGLQRSTDSGQTWANVRWAQASFDVDFDPSDGRLAVAHFLDWDSTVNDWVHSAGYSTDGGVTWTTAAGLDHQQGFGSRIELAYAPSNPSIVYANCASNNGLVWKSTDGGQSYAPVTTTGNTGASWYACPMWVSPSDPNRLIAGGYVFVTSSDGGQTLTQLSGGYILTQDAHPDSHFVMADPGWNGTTNRRVYVTTDGGLFRAEDLLAAAPGAGWETLAQTYQTTQFYGAQGDGPTGLLYGGTQDNGTLRVFTGDTTATLPYGGDGGYCAVDSVNPQNCYGEYIDLEIHRSNDGGNSAADIWSSLPDAGTRANFIAPFILDPGQQGRMLAGGGSLWRSDDVATGNPPTWTAIRPSDTDVISAIAVAPSDSNVIWVGQNDAHVAMTTNGLDASPTWVTIDDNGANDPLPNRWPARILIDPDDSQLVYVAFGGWSDGNLMRTRDGGRTWTDVTGDGATGLPFAPIRGIARHPQHAEWLYVGTEVGIFSTEDGGVTWSATNEGPSNVSVDELDFLHHSTTLLAATHGRGLWTAETCVPAPVSVAVTLQGQTAVRVSWDPVPGAQSYVVYSSGTSGGPYALVASTTSTSFIDRPPSAGRWFYVVRAVGPCESVDSTEVYVDFCLPASCLPVAADADPCAASGILVSWGVPDWNDLAGGFTRTLSVERDGAAMTAGGCSLVSNTDMSCLDETAGLGMPHDYVLVAANSCRLVARLDAGVATDVITLPPAIPDGTLRVSRTRATGNLGFRWTDIPEATAGYVVLEDPSPRGSFGATLVAAPTGVTPASAPEPAGVLWCFLVAGVGPCGQGPAR